MGEHSFYRSYDSDAQGLSQCTEVLVASWLDNISQRACLDRDWIHRSVPRNKVELEYIRRPRYGTDTRNPDYHPLLD